MNIKITIKQIKEEASFYMTDEDQPVSLTDEQAQKIIYYIKNTAVPEAITDAINYYLESPEEFE